VTDLASLVGVPTRGLRTRLTATVVAIGTAAVVGLAVTLWFAARTFLEEEAGARLQAVADAKAAEARRWVERERSFLTYVASAPTAAAVAHDLAGRERAPDEPARAWIETVRRTAPDHREVFLLSPTGGQVVLSTDSSSEGRFETRTPFWERGREGPFVTGVYTSPETGRPELTLAVPVRGGDGALLGVLASHLDLARLDAIVDDRTGLTEGAEAYLVSSSYDFVSADRFGRDAFRRGVATPGVRAALDGRRGVDAYANYAGVSVLGAFEPLGELGLALLVEVPRSVALAPARQLLGVVVGVGLLAVLLMAVGATVAADRIAQPIEGLTGAAVRLASGQFEVDLPEGAPGEVGVLAEAFRSMTGRLRSLVDDLGHQVKETLAASAEVRRQREHLQAIVDNATSWIAVVDRQGRLTLANQRLEDLLGVGPGQALGRVLTDVLPAQDTEAVREAIAAALDGAENGAEITLRPSVEGETGASLDGGTPRPVGGGGFPDEGDGAAGNARGSEPVYGANDPARPVAEGVVYLVHAFPLVDGAGRVYGAGVLGTDLTEQRRREAERRRFEQQLRHRQKLESLGVMAGGIAHDFNNLLAAILGHAAMALEDRGGEEARRHHVEQVVSAAERAAELTKQMLAYAGQRGLRTEAVDLNASIRSMSELFAVTIPKQVQVELRLDEQPVTTSADPAQITQVLMNLITNAADAMREGGGTLTVLTRRERVSKGLALPGVVVGGPLRPGDYAVAEVRDTGPGIPAENLRRIFEPSYSTKAEGRGLGLAAVQGIVRASGGAMVIESEPGRGTAFRVYLPLTEGAEPVREPESVVDHADPRGRTVLVADDEDAVRGFVVRALAHHGFDVVEAPDGVRAVELFRTNGRIDAVVLDLTMPGLTGGEALREIRSLQPDVPVVLCSGYDAANAAADLRDYDRVEFLQKPFRGAELIRTLRQLLD